MKSAGEPYPSEGISERRSIERGTIYDPSLRQIIATWNRLDETCQCLLCELVLFLCDSVDRIEEH